MPADPYARIDELTNKLIVQGYSPDYAAEKAAEIIDTEAEQVTDEDLQWD